VTDHSLIEAKALRRALLRERLSLLAVITIALVLTASLMPGSW
jgi:hypothetical protein